MSLRNRTEGAVRPRRHIESAGLLVLAKLLDSRPLTTTTISGLSDARRALAIVLLGCSSRWSRRHEVLCGKSMASLHVLATSKSSPLLIERKSTRGQLGTLRGFFDEVGDRLPSDAQLSLALGHVVPERHIAHRGVVHHPLEQR